jgi:hypothetical protein
LYKTEKSAKKYSGIAIINAIDVLPTSDKLQQASPKKSC